MKLIDTIDIKGGVHGQIELRQGDLTALEPDEAVEVLIVSAFPNNYVPTQGSLIGALHRRGLSVAEIARGKDIDIRANYGCWLSDPFRTTDPGLRFNRIFGFEPLTRGNPPEVVSDIFRALGPVLKVRQEVRSIAMPIVAAGDQGYSVEEMLVPLLDAAIHWLEIGLPLDRLVIAARTERAAERAAAIFAAAKAAYTKPVVETATVEDYDVFISYAHEDREVVDRLVAEMLELRPQAKIFLDRNELQVGAAWQMRIFESLARSRKVVAVLSPDYLASTVCKEEFSIAWIEGYQRGRLLLPVYARSTDLPAYMRYLQYTDAREGDSSRLREAARQVLEALDGHSSDVEFASTSETPGGGSPPTTSVLGMPANAWAATPAYAAIGRALERIVQIGSADPVIRDGLDAFAELALGALAATAIRENPQDPDDRMTHAVAGAELQQPEPEITRSPATADHETTVGTVVIDEAALLIRIAKLYRPGMSDLELYEATRGVWRVGPRREGADLACCVVNGVILEVYEIDGWYPAGSTVYETRPTLGEDLTGRWEFLGRVAGQQQRDRLVGRSVKDYFKQGSQNPVTYVNC